MNKCTQQHKSRTPSILIWSIDFTKTELSTKVRFNWLNSFIDQNWRLAICDDQLCIRR